MKNKRTLLFGASGQVGTELRRLWKGGGLVAMTRADCDIREPSALRTAIHNADPDLILNAAAYTAVDQAETDIEQCFAINSLAPRIMAEEAAASGALLVHYSTDYVFDGRKDAPYTESDAVNPQNQYGLSKLEGERAIQASGAKYLIFRTSWVFSPHGHNFLLTMLRLGKERTCLKIVDDQVGSPT
jgi:dTDP-4-dehydrorhamnose reductase